MKERIERALAIWTQSTTEKVIMEPTLVRPKILILDPYLPMPLSDIPEDKLWMESKIDRLPPHSVLSRVDTLLPKKVVCVTLKDDPIRPQCLSDKQLPILKKSRIDAAEPILADERMEMFEPRLR
jgi:hypothetical protein